MGPFMAPGIVAILTPARRAVPQGPSAAIWVLVGFLVFWSTGCNLCAVGMAFDDLDAGPIIMMVVMGLPFLGGAIALGLWARKKKTRADRIGKLMGLMAASAQLPMHVLQADLQLDATQTRQFVLQALAEGYVQGRLDIEHGVLLSANVDDSFQQVSASCTQCGAGNVVHRRLGQAVPCRHCGAPLSL